MAEIRRMTPELVQSQEENKVGEKKKQKKAPQRKSHIVIDNKGKKIGLYTLVRGEDGSVGSTMAVTGKNEAGNPTGYGHAPVRTVGSSTRSPEAIIVEKERS